MRAALTLLAPLVGLAMAAAPAQAESYFLILSGLGGETKYQEKFTAQTTSLTTVARRTAGDNSRVVVLTGEEATREALETSIAALAKKAKAADTFAVFLIGHGSFDGEAYKLNLPGPDIDGEELGKLLSTVPARSQLIVNATSASGAVLETWKAEGRTVITATRSGMERNATRFAEHWAAALSDGAADINKNGVITAQEAFDFTTRAVADSFEADGTLATEHPQISGDNAARFNVARLQARSASTPAVTALNTKLEGLEAQIEQLRGRRAQLPADEYLNQLQELLVQLATVQAQIDAAEGQ